MVTKVNSKRRMCVDYTNLNKVCPNDSYPLPIIDQLVDGAIGHKILSFLDAYFGYKQISMHLRDKLKRRCKLLLRGNVVWLEDSYSDLSEAHGQGFQRNDRPEHGGICGRHNCEIRLM